MLAKIVQVSVTAAFGVLAAPAAPTWCGTDGWPARLPPEQPMAHLALLAGSPPDPARLLIRSFDANALGELDDMWREWEAWFAEAAGLPLRSDREQIWRDWAGWRVNYDSVLVDLARITHTPPSRLLRNVGEWMTTAPDA